MPLNCKIRGCLALIPEAEARVAGCRQAGRECPRWAAFLPGRSTHGQPCCLGTWLEWVWSKERREAESPVAPGESPSRRRAGWRWCPRLGPQQLRPRPAARLHPTCLFTCRRGFTSRPLAQSPPGSLGVGSEVTEAVLAPADLLAWGSHILFGSSTWKKTHTQPHRLPSQLHSP